MNGTENERARDLERLEKLRPIDDEFMRCMFRDNPGLVQTALRTITGDGGICVETSETQRDAKRLAGGRSVMFDVWARDGCGTCYDMEVERSDATPQRARYHGAALDVEALHSGKRSAKLPPCTVVFVCEDDPFGCGKGTYRFERAETEQTQTTGRLLGDGSVIIYANARYNGNDELGALMRDFLRSDPDEMETPEMAQRARYLKRNPEGVQKMSAILDEMREEAMQKGMEKGMEKGLEKGIQKGMKKGVKKGMKKGADRERASFLARTAATVREGTLTLQQASESFGFTEAEIRAAM